MFVDTLRERLSWVIAQKGLSKADLARLAHVSRATVTQWMNGEIRSISTSTLYRMCIALNVDPNWLSQGKGDPARKAVPHGDMEARALKAFSLLLADQQLAMCEQMEELASKNREVLGELLKKYGDPVPDYIVEKSIPLPPK